MYLSKREALRLADMTQGERDTFMLKRFQEMGGAISAEILEVVHSLKSEVQAVQREVDQANGTLQEVNRSTAQIESGVSDIRWQSSSFQCNASRY